MSGSRPWYKHPGRLAGVGIALYFAGKLLVLLHLGVGGRVVPGFTGRLAQGEVSEPGSLVAYSYQAYGIPRFGWRRGVEYGGEELSVSYSPLLPRLHVTSLRPGLRSACSFWTESDYWLRLLLAAGGIAVGIFVERQWVRFERRGGVFLGGLTREASG